MLESGEVVDGRFQIEALVGEGGLAHVYRVRHTALGSVHALKLLSWRKKSLAERLILEGRIQAQLSHPNIVAVTDLVRHDGQLGLLMEYVDNRSLEDHLNDDGGFGLDKGLKLFAPILSAVTAAHDAGVTHRDLKPANVLLAQSARGVIPKVTDFGIAKVVAEVAGGSTAVGATMGTPGYLAPEQVRDSSAIDRRADIFALGAILYEIITGYRAFADEKGKLSVGNTTNITPKPLVTWLKETPEHIQQAVDRSLAKDPDNRYPDCRSFARDLYRDHPRLLSMVEGQMATGTLSLRSDSDSIERSLSGGRRAQADAAKAVHSNPTLQPAPASSDTGMTGPQDRDGVGSAVATGDDAGGGMWVALAIAFVGAVVLAVGLGLVAAVMGNSMFGEDPAGANPDGTVDVQPDDLPEPTPPPDPVVQPDAQPDGTPAPDGTEAPDTPEDPDATNPDGPEPSETPDPDGANGANGANATDATDGVAATDVPSPSPEPEQAPRPEPSPDVTPDPAPVEQPAPEPVEQPEPAPDVEPDVEPEPDPAPDPTPDPVPEPEPVEAAQPDPTPAPDPEPVATPPELGGTWRGKASNRPFRLIIQPGTTSGSVTGEAVFPAATASRSESLSGTVDADGVVSLRAAEFTFTGRLTGDRLSGTYVASGSNRYLDWSVKR